MSSNGGKGAMPKKVELHEDMALFDALPCELRRALNNAWFHYAAEDVIAHMNMGYSPAQLVDFVPKMDAFLAAKSPLRSVR